MSRRVLFSVLALAVVFALGGAEAHAQPAQKVAADIGFPFVAGGKEMPAGKYAISVPDNGPVMVTGPGGVRAVLPVITTLARHAQDPESKFVFDKLDGKATLSEIWLPNKDGLLLVATKAPHEHAVLGAPGPVK